MQEIDPADSEGKSLASKNPRFLGYNVILASL